MADDRNPREEARTSFFRPFDSVEIHQGQLPHWRQAGVTYFVTGRLADSLPQMKLREWKEQRQAWLRAHGIASLAELSKLPEVQVDEFHQRFTRRWHAWLDAGYGECMLRKLEIRLHLVKRFLAQEGKEYELDAWVVMPNHFHALLTPKAVDLGTVLRNWKGGSGYEINRALHRRGALWQAEPHDHIVRSEAQWWHYHRYVAENPIKAGLCRDEYAVGVGRIVWPSAKELLQRLPPV